MFIDNLTRFRRSFKAEAGFTLIELLISSAILLVIVGGGIASFITFNDKQTLLAAVKGYQGMLRSAQVKAAVSDVITGCETVGGNKLWAYRVSAKADSTGAQVLMSALCAPNKFAATTGTEVGPREVYQLPPGISVTATELAGGGSMVSQDFYVLHGGVDVNGDNPAGSIAVTITLTGPDTASYSFDVTQGGEITEGALN